jgi:cytochrome c-type biogenesis protein CcmH
LTLFVGIVLGLAIALAVGLTPALAETPVSDQQLQVERQLGCPICTNVPLNVCDNQICQQMKGVIHQKLADGESPAQIVDYFVARYGEGVLLTPPGQGFSLAVWYAPIMAVLLGALLVWALVRNSVRRQSVIQKRLEVPDPDLDRYRSQVRQDVEHLGEIR